MRKIPPLKTGIAVMIVWHSWVVLWLSASCSCEIYHDEFEKYIQKYQKIYDESDYFIRFEAFKKNYNHIQNFDPSIHSFTIALNQFADYTENEVSLRNFFLELKNLDKAIQIR